MFTWSYGSTLKDVEWVYSKDQALSQSKEFLKELNVQTVAYPNTAMAAQYISAQKDVHKAAIGAKENAELYGLKVLATNIQENTTNTTRFLVIGLKPQIQEIVLVWFYPLNMKVELWLKLLIVLPRMD